MGSPRQAVSRVDGLAAGVDDAAGRGEERAAAVGVAEGGEALPGRGASRLGRQPRPRQARPTVSTRSRTQLDAMTGRTHSAPGSVADRSSGLTLRPRPPLETRTSALDPLGEQVAELHGDAATEGVADESDAVDAEPVEEVAQGGGVRAERVVTDRLRGGAVTEEVGDDDPVVGVEPVDEVGPVRVGPSSPWMKRMADPWPVST